MAGEFDLGGQVRPWGRRAVEYEAFFSLPAGGPALRVLDCAAGPASFTAQWAERGHFTVAIDPLYACAPSDIRAAFERTKRPMLEGMRDAAARFRWDFYSGPDVVLSYREKALDDFLSAFTQPGVKGRYIAGALPNLPLRSSSFDLVLCSHLLFLYSENFDCAAHVRALRECLRVGAEVRVFPLLNLDGELSEHVQPVMQTLAEVAVVERVEVDFEFQRGATEMLRLVRRTDAEPA